MDFDLANRYAEEISQGGNQERHKELVAMCVPYLLFLKKRFGFHCILRGEVKNELAADAVSDAIVDRQRRNLPFTLCLQNTFRDLCRKRVRITREHDTGNIIGQCDMILHGSLVGVSTPLPPPSAKAQDKELIKLTKTILRDHDSFSKKAVYHKIKGSTYPEMSDILKTTSDECKRVYWHDINDIRKKLNPNPLEY